MLKAFPRKKVGWSWSDWLLYRFASRRDASRLATTRIAVALSRVLLKSPGKIGIADISSFRRGE